MKTKICIFVETPFQLLNYINYLYHQTDFENAVFDLFIRKEAYFSEDLVQRVKKTDLFNDIYLYQYNKKDFEHITNLGVFVYKLRRFCFPRHYLRSISISKIDLSTLHYDYLFCSNSFGIARTYTMIEPEIKIWVFDDGIGTYINSVALSSRKRSLIYRIKGKTSPWERIDRIVVNNTKLLPHTNIEVSALNSLAKAENRFNSLVNTVFDYRDCDKYDINRLVYLTQPFNPINLNNFRKTEQRIIDGISDVTNECTLRIHPRQNDFVECGFSKDDVEALWELVCARQINDNHILIGCYSTAQFSPKLLFNKEPWLVFTYELYAGLFDERIKSNMRKMVDLIRTQYSNEQRIIVLQSIEDLKKVISELINK